MRTEPRFLICFDFPELNGDPVFAEQFVGGWGVSPSLTYATRFESEASAERTLQNSYRPDVRRWGCVVEVAG